MEPLNVGISLGWNCYSAVWSVQEGIRQKKCEGYLTCPFDILVSNYEGITKCIKDDFKYMCDEKYLEILINGNETYIYNNLYKFIFNHESPGHANLYITENWEEGTNHFINNNYKNLKLRYHARIENFKKYMRENNVTFILTTWNKTEDDLYELKDVLKEKYPDLKYNFKILNDIHGEEYFIEHLKLMKVN
jgi:hypothetical protein